MRMLATSMLMALLALLPQPASAASGTALGVRQDAVLEQKSGNKTLVVGTDIFIGDRVVTDDNGLVQIRFSDRTELVVGPRSSLVIEDYLLREDGSGGKFAINVLGGTFRFVTGGAPKDRYLITTPSGTVGVRGTAFDGNVKPDHSSFLLYHGAIIICNNAGQCVTISDHCDIGMFDPTQATFLGDARDTTGANRTSMRGMFRWSVSEAELMGSFRIDGARECLNRAVVNTVPDSLAPTGDGEPPNRDRRG